VPAFNPAPIDVEFVGVLLRMSVWIAPTRVLSTPEAMLEGPPPGLKTDAVVLK